jgi:hypothetical protein
LNQFSGRKKIIPPPFCTSTCTVASCSKYFASVIYFIAMWAGVSCIIYLPFGIAFFLIIK